MKVLSSLVFYALTGSAMIFFTSSAKSAFDLPTVYRSTVTQECVRATDSHGHKISCKQAKKGQYHEVWI